MRSVVSSYTTGIKSYPLVSSLALILPVCTSVPESVPGAPSPSPQLFYWDNALVETRSLAPLISSQLVPFDHDQFFSRTVISVCLKIFYPPNKQFSSHSSRLFLLFRLKIAGNCSVLPVLDYVICFVCFSNQNRTFGNQKRFPNTQQSATCSCQGVQQQYLHSTERVLYSTYYTHVLIWIWFSPTQFSMCLA